jgi:hypothetical protein
VNTWILGATLLQLVYDLWLQVLFTASGLAFIQKELDRDD